MSETNINPVAGLLRQARFSPRSRAIIYEDQVLDYGQLADDAARYARAFAAAGVRPGDRVAYLGLNSLTFFRVMLGAWWIGAVFQPLNFRLAPREIKALLERATPRVLVTEPCHQDVVDHVVDLTAEEGAGSGAAGVGDAPSGAAPLPVLVDDDASVPVKAAVREHWQLLTGFLAAADAAPTPEPLPARDTDLAILMFTSGTTGQPKGVQLTHGNVWWNSVNVDSLVDTRRGDVNLAVAPLFHIGGLNALTVRVLVRGGVTLIRRTFDPRQVLADIEQYQVNQAFLVPSMLSAMRQVEEFERHDLTSLRALICAGAPVPPVLLKQYETKGIAVQQAWGLTETAPFATYLPTELTYEKPGSCGIPMPYTDVRVVDPVTGTDVTEPGATGELWVRGPNVTPGYWNNPEATAAAFQEGWFRSGDLGYQDADGYFYIVDRLKDMIVTGGENVYPAEVERALMEYPGVLDVAVVGVQDPKWGENVVAVMACRDGVVPTIEDVREFAAGYLARYKLPKKLIVTGTVPRNGSGKLDKTSIRQMAQNGVSA